MNGIALLTALAFLPSAHAGFVHARGTRLEIDGKPYRFIGANFWYGMNLGADDETGDRERLRRELDRLKAIGATNLRVLGASQGPDADPERISPSLEPRPGELNSHVLRGLDFLLSEMGRRGMRAVVCLNNFWPWSGGMAQYRSWSDGSPIPTGWPEIQSYASTFYSSPRATALADALIAKIVRRHAGDPTIMAWELANEPRGGAGPTALAAWLDRTAGLIKSLDHNHLVTTGSEGDTPFSGDAGNDLARDHLSPNIDYVTIHVWAQNWGWYAPTDPATLEPAIAKMKAYVASQVAKARALGKPLVIEEFGLARDGGRFDAGSPTTARDRYYRELFATAFSSGVAGLNFWAWAGEGRARVPGGHWRRGDPFIGEPPPENQGWYSVYDTDASTLGLIRGFAAPLTPDRPSF